MTGASGTDCNPVGASCIDSSQNGFPGFDEVTFNAVQGQTYFFIVDGFGGATSGYELDVTCNKN